MTSLGVLAFVGSAVLSTLTSISPWTSLWGDRTTHAGLVTMLAGAIVFVAARWVCTSVSVVRRLAVAALLGAGANVAYAIVQWCGADPFAWHEFSQIGGQVRPFGMFGHPNFLAGYLVACVPLGLWLAGTSAGAERWRVASGWLLLTGACGVVVVATLSRGAWLACVIVMLTGVLIVRWRWFVGATVAVAVMALLGVVLGPPTARTVVAQRLQQLTADNSRSLIWSAAGTIGSAHPLTGSGLDTFRLAITPLRSPALWHAERGRTPTRAHNELLQTWATQGAVGLGAVALLLVGIGQAILRGWQIPTRRGLIVALSLSGLAFAVQVQFSLAVVGCTTLAVVVLAALSQCPNWTELAAEPWSRRAFAGAGAALMLGLAVVAPWWWADLACAAGGTHLATSASCWPTQTRYCVRYAEALSEAGALTQAECVLARACALVPADAELHAAHGQVLFLLAQQTGAPGTLAYAAFDRALARDPHHPFYAYQAGQAALALHDHAQARRYADQPYAHVLLDTLAGLIALRAGDYATAHTHLHAADVGEWERVELLPEAWLARTADAIALEALGERPAALALYERVVAGCPEQGVAVQGVARLRQQLKK
jgi:O-antigen ligase